MNSFFKQSKQVLFHFFEGSQNLGLGFVVSKNFRFYQNYCIIQSSLFGEQRKLSKQSFLGKPKH